jgi:hypothetical protein
MNAHSMNALFIGEFIEGRWWVDTGNMVFGFVRKQVSKFHTEIRSYSSQSNLEGSFFVE